MTLSQWAPVLINLVGFAVFFGMAITRLKYTEDRVKEIPAEAEKVAKALDEKGEMKHLYECHPRAHKRATGQTEVIS